MSTPLPSTWIPTSETELEAALREGAFTESHYRDAKESLRSSKEQAKDMASFAVDGGLIVVGVKEDKPNRWFDLAPLEYEDQIEEGRERIAHTLCDPPLVVRTRWLPSVREEGRGYLLVEVPPSAVAPHQVEGRYYGRGEKEKRPLSDPEVERLVLARKASLSDIRDELRRIVAEDPWPDGEFPHLHVVARPVRAPHRVFLDVTSGSGSQFGLLELVRKLPEALARKTGDPGNVTGMVPSFSSCLATSTTAGGVVLSNRQLHQDRQFLSEERDIRVAVLEDGGLRLYSGRMGDRSRDDSSGPLYVFEHAVAYNVRCLIDMSVELSKQASYGGAWDIAVSVTGLRDTMTHLALPEFGFGNYSRYDRDSYSEAVRVSSIEAEQSGRVTELLVGSLLRTYRTDQRYKALLSDDGNSS